MESAKRFYRALEMKYFFFKKAPAGKDN